MRSEIKGALAATILGLSMFCIVAAASGDRLKSPVQVGQGTAVANKIVFDNGNGATAPMVAGDTGSSVGINTTAPAGTLGVAAYSGADVTVFATRAGTATGQQRWKLLPSSGTTPGFEIDADHSGVGTMLIQSDAATILSLKHNGDVALPQGNFSAVGNGTFGGVVGIGTATPGYDLEVKDTSAGADVVTFATRAGTPTGNQRWYMLPSTGATPRFEIDATNTTMVIQSDAANLLTMTHDGKVGLSTSPNQRLDVAGSANVSSNVMFSNQMGFYRVAIVGADNMTCSAKCNATSAGAGFYPGVAACITGILTSGGNVNQGCAFTFNGTTTGNCLCLSNI